MSADNMDKAETSDKNPPAYCDVAPEFIWDVSIPPPPYLLPAVPSTQQQSHNGQPPPAYSAQSVYYIAPSQQPTQLRQVVCCVIGVTLG